MNSYEKVVKLCNSHKISISKLERTLGFSNGSLKGRGTGNISYERLEKIADFFHVDINKIRNDSIEHNDKNEDAIFEIDLNKLQGDRKQFAENLINIYLAGVYSDEETFNLIRKGLDADLDMVMALINKNKRRD